MKKRLNPIDKLLGSLPSWKELQARADSLWRTKSDEIDLADVEVNGICEVAFAEGLWSLLSGADKPTFDADEVARRKKLRAKLLAHPDALWERLDAEMQAVAAVGYYAGFCDGKEPAECLRRVCSCRACRKGTTK